MDWNEKNQIRRTTEIDRILEVIASGLPFRCKITMTVDVPQLPYPYDEVSKPVPPTMKNKHPKPPHPQKELPLDDKPDGRGVKAGDKHPHCGAPGIAHCTPVGEEDSPVTTRGTPRRRRRNFTAEEVIEIRKMSAEGMSGAAIARLMDVSTGTINKLLRGETYPKVEEREDANPED